MTDKTKCGCALHYATHMMASPPGNRFRAACGVSDPRNLVTLARAVTCARCRDTHWWRRVDVAQSFDLAGDEDNGRYGALDPGTRAR